MAAQSGAIVITGAAGGMGIAIARKLAAALMSSPR
jgi:NAD(P)-dependent dehydrogenase (short-subunit alcohol dehydrogenase family)